MAVSCSVPYRFNGGPTVGDQTVGCGEGACGVAGVCGPDGGAPLTVMAQGRRSESAGRYSRAIRSVTAVPIEPAVP